MPTASAKEKNSATSTSMIRTHLQYILNGDGAHADFNSAVKDFPEEQRGTRPQGASHSPWEVLEHLRIAQRDVLDGINNPNHVQPEFPSGYWPTSQQPKSAKDWDRSVISFKQDFQAILDLMDERDPMAPLHGSADQTIARRLLMLADHTSYHLGELILLRRLLGAWNE
ncbi:MAG TPA: DinB family protein [Terriglobales bacterium]|nr:DinB family protein [Terriglobales bacterium]